jgi:nucleoid-associated protein YgaU
MSDIDIWNAFHVRPLRPDAVNNKSLWERMPIMRKEVKLGFAIGGVVLAVVLVWVLSLGGSKTRTVVASATEGKADATSITPSDDSLNNDKPQVAESAAQAPAIAAQPTTAPARETATADARKTGGDLDWSKLLNGSQQIPLMTQTPIESPAKTVAPVAPSTPQATAADPATAAQANTDVASATAGSDVIPAAAPAADTPDNTASAQPVAEVAAATPANNSATAGARSHQIQQGETLSSIAMAAYGSPNFYPAILRANPKLNPRRMKPGMTIVLPDVSEVKHDAAAPSAAHSTAPEAHQAAATADGSRQYKVQPGDSLYRISMKLYGNSKMQDKIYELNRTTIGPSKERVRVGMVLKLPTAPTAGAH